MLVEQDKNAVLWNGMGRVQEVKWDESNSQKKTVILMSCFLFVLTQVNGSKNIRLDRAFIKPSFIPFK